MLSLKLSALAEDEVRGVYGESKLEMPKRMRFLRPEAAAGYRALGDGATVSDMFRSAEGSLLAVRGNRNALPPAFSAHNYGLAIDIDIDDMIARGSFGTKAKLDAMMESHGWFCHRRDHKLASEAWHFNFLGVGTVVPDELTSTAPLVEARILELYGDDLVPDERECQRMLAKLHMYSGAIDGLIGPLSREAIRVFQRAWALAEDGELGPRTRRTLAYVTAER